MGETLRTEPSGAVIASAAAGAAFFSGNYFFTLASTAPLLSCLSGLFVHYRYRCAQKIIYDQRQNLKSERQSFIYRLTEAQNCQAQLNQELSQASTNLEEKQQKHRDLLSSQEEIQQKLQETSKELQDYKDRYGEKIEELKKYRLGLQEDNKFLEKNVGDLIQFNHDFKQQILTFKALQLELKVTIGQSAWKEKREQMVSQTALILDLFDRIDQMFINIQGHYDEIKQDFITYRQGQIEYVEALNEYVDQQKRLQELNTILCEFITIFSDRFHDVPERVEGILERLSVDEKFSIPIGIQHLVTQCYNA
ncbi:MAG: hypothetical protein ACQEP8_03470 [Chlamydiota bacterium]